MYHELSMWVTNVGGVKFAIIKILDTKKMAVA
jgi:hypothetical protein